MISSHRDLPDHLFAELQRLGAADDRLLIAVSGGPDSLALLHALSNTNLRGQLVVAHVDHGIDSSSADIAAAVAVTARSLGLPMVARRLQLGADASEGRARDARYEALEQMRLESDARWIVTAHHADDQAETVILRVLHGSGPAGLAAMAPIRGRILRPLLAMPRNQLAAYATEHSLTPWSDPANSDRRHDRAWIRHDLMPLLAERIPDAPSVLRRVATQAAADRTAWDQLLDAWAALDTRSADGVASVAVQPLVGCDSVLAAAIIQGLARRVDCPMGIQRAGALVRWVQGATVGGAFSLPARWSGVLHRGRLELSRSAKSHAVPDCIIEGSEGTVAWGSWRLDWRAAAAGSVSRQATSSWFAAEGLALRGSQPGDVIVPFGGRGRRRVVRCLQDAGVQPDHRPNWPVLVAGEDVVWVLGVCRGAGATAKPGEDALRVDVTQS